MFTSEEFVLRFNTLQPLNQTDSEPKKYSGEKKAIGMRTYQTILRDFTPAYVPFVSAESITNRLRASLWHAILQRFGYTVEDFRTPVGATLTYLMLSGGDVSIGRKIKAVEQADRLATLSRRLPIFGAFGGTFGGNFFPSQTRISFAVPFVQDLDQWRWYLENTDPDHPLHPAPLPIRQCLAQASSTEHYHHAISYFRHPPNLGSFVGTVTVKDPVTNKEVTTTDLKPLDPMPHTFEYIPSGVPMAFLIQFDTEANAVLRGAVRYAFDHWLNDRQQAVLGAHANRGFGRVQFLHVPQTGFPESDPFETWLTTHHDALHQVLNDFAGRGAITPQDLKADKNVANPDVLWDALDRWFDFPE